MSAHVRNQASPIAAAIKQAAITNGSITKLIARLDGLLGPDAALKANSVAISRAAVGPIDALSQLDAAVDSLEQVVQRALLMPLPPKTAGIGAYWVN